MRSEILCKNVEMHILETGKFKDVILSFRFFNELKTPDSWVRTVLALMLADRCEKYPTKREVSCCLDGLYGASASARTTTYGQGQILEFRVKALNEKYVGGDLLQRQIALAAQFLLHPLKEGDQLSPALFKEAMINLKAMIQRRSDNPSAYAASQCAKLMGQGQALGISVLPTMEEAEAITLEQVSAAYEKMIREDRIDMFVEGQVDAATVTSLLKHAFPLEDRELEIKSEYLTEKEQPEEKSETRAIDQTTLVMMYPTHVTLSSPDYWTLRTGSCIFGQLPTSLLFQEVREKRSLCYSIYSSILSYDGVMSVSTGIDSAHLDEVKELVEQQRQRMAEGDFDEEMLNAAKEMLINSILASEDDPLSMINREFQNCLLGQTRSLDKISDEIRSVDREAIRKLFAAMECKAVFALIQKEDAHEENC